MQNKYKLFPLKIRNKGVLFNVFVAIEELVFVYNSRYCKINVNKNPTDATVCRYLFTAKLLYIFRVS